MTGRNDTASDEIPTDALTDQQQAIDNAAMELAAVLDSVVPDDVIHYAITEARSAVRELRRMTHTIKTADHPSRA